MPTKKQDKPFDQFTNLYELSKTLRFELKPVPETKRLLGLDKSDTKKFPNDLYRAENFEIIKKYTDILHRDFIKEALGNVDLDFSEYLSKYKSSKKNKIDASDDNEEGDNKDELRKTEKELRAKIASFFNAVSKVEQNNKQYKDWVRVEIGKKEDNNAKNKISGKLFGKELIEILKNCFEKSLEKKESVPVLFFNKGGNKEERMLKDVFGNFDKFTTYFTDSFYNNRKNYYKAEGKVGQVATRIIDENLKKFCNNLIAFQGVISQYDELLKIFDSGWQEYFREKKMEDGGWARAFKSSGYGWRALLDNVNEYNGLLLQNKIDKYNYIVKKLNKDINEFTQKPYRSIESGNNNKPEIKLFERLYKQVHGEKNFQRDEIEVDGDNIFADIVPDFIRHSDQKLGGAKEMTRIFIGQKIDDLGKIYLSRRAIETISSKWFRSWQTLGELVLEYLNRDLLESKRRKKLPDFIEAKKLKIVLDVNKEKSDELFKRKYFEDKDGNKIKIDFVDWAENNNAKKELKFEENNNWQNFLNIFEYEFGALLDQYQTSRDQLSKLIDAKIKYAKNDDGGQIAIIKNFADSALGIFRMTNYFALRKRGVAFEPKGGKDDNFYNNLMDRYLEGDESDNEPENKIKPYYDALRNFITKKAWSIDRVRLCFENSQLLGGWPKSQEKVKGGVILRKNISNGEKEKKYLYFLAMLDEKNKNYFEDKKLYKDIVASNWQKMNYTQLQNPSRMLPKMFITPFLVKDKETKEWININRLQSIWEL